MWFLFMLLTVSAAPTPVRIAIPHTSGRWKTLSDDKHVVFDMWKSFVDVHGGISVNGVTRPIEFVNLTMKDTVNSTMAVYSDLMRGNFGGPVDIVVLPYTSEYTAAAAAIVWKASPNQVMIADGATSNALFICDETLPAPCTIPRRRRFERMWSVTSPGEVYFDSLAMLVRIRGVKKVGIVYDTRVGSPCLVLRTRFPDLGIETVMQQEVKLPVTNASAAAVLSDIRASNAEFFFFCTQNDFCEAIWNAMKDQDWVPPGFGFVVCSNPPPYAVLPSAWEPSVRGYEFSTMASHAAFPMFIPQGPNETSSGLFYSEFVKRTNRVPVYQVAHALRTVTTIHTAIMLAESTSADAVNMAIAEMREESTTGHIAFDAVGRILTPMLSVQLGEQVNIREIVAPLSAATNEMVYPIPSLRQRACMKAKACAKHGKCVSSGECQCERGWKGPTCSEEVVLGTTGLDGGIVSAIVIGVVFLLALPVTWKLTENHRHMRKLLDTNKVATELAESVAIMDFQGVAYLHNIPDPTRIQRAFLKIISDLKEYKSFMPQAVLMPVEAIANAPCPIEVPDEEEPPTSIIPGTNPVHARISRLRESGFRMFSATFACMAMPKVSVTADSSMLYSTMQLFVIKALDTFERHNGVVVAVYADRVVAAWNVYKPCQTHEMLACETALDVVHVLSTLTFPGDPASTQARIVVTTGNVLVGFLGSDKIKSPVVVGESLTLIPSLIDICEMMGARIVVSEAIAMKVRSHLAVCPIDVIRTGTATMTLFELFALPAGQTPEGFERNGAFYKEGFSAFLTQQYLHAVGYLTSFVRIQHAVKHEMQLLHAKRIVRLCIHFKAEAAAGRPRAGPYARTIGQSDCFELAAAHVNLPTALAQGNQGAESPVLSPWVSPPQGERVDEVQKLMGTAVVNEEIALEFKDIKGRQYHKGEKRLGQGATSEVWLGMREDGSLVALKAMLNRQRYSKKWMEAVLHEVSVLSVLSHDNIVAYIGCAIVSQRLIIITEYVSGGSLQNVLETFGKIPTRSVKRYLREILHGLVYLHANDILHRDLKPANVLLMIDGQCKLTDFGSAVMATDDGSMQPTSSLGTRGYMAPEAVGGTRGKAGDVWSLGVMTFQLLTGRLPMANMEPNPNIDPSAQDFISKCLQLVEANRLSAEALLSHAFLL